MTRPLRPSPQARQARLKEIQARIDAVQDKINAWSALTPSSPPGIVDRATLKQIYQTLTKNEIPLNKNGDPINFNPPNHQPSDLYAPAPCPACQTKQAQIALLCKELIAEPCPDFGESIEDWDELSSSEQNVKWELWSLRKVQDKKGQTQP